MADRITEEPVPKSSTGDNDSTKEERDKFERRSAPSGAAKEPQNNFTPDTVPRSQYEGVLDRLETLERRIQKFDKSIDSISDVGDDDDADDPPGGAIQGPWIDGSMMKNIHFMIKSARSHRKNWKESLKRRNEAHQREKDEKELRERLLDGDESQNAAQVLLGGSKAKLNYLSWKSFEVGAEKHSRPLLEPIDVLIEEPNVFGGSIYEKEIDIQQETESDRASRDSISRYFPERIRIHSWLLVRLLKGASGTYVDWQSDGTIFLRPFKFLVHNEPLLRAASKRLRERINVQAKAGSPALSRVAKLPRSEGDDEDDGSAEKIAIDFPSPGEMLENEFVAQGTQVHEDGGGQNDNQSDNKSDNESDNNVDSKIDNEKSIIINSTTLLHLVPMRHNDKERRPIEP